tara:strand:- start:245 stop:430 length:186 start_codon:yes stop_codon:yes gene_type:complete
VRKESRLTIRIDSEVMKELKRLGDKCQATTAQIGREAIAIYLDVMKRRIDSDQGEVEVVET